MATAGRSAVRSHQGAAAFPFPGWRLRCWTWSKLSHSLWRGLSVIGERRHTNHPMYLLVNSDRQGGWYGYFYSIGMGGPAATVFSPFHGAHGPAVRPPADRVGPVHHPADHHRPPGLRRLGRGASSRCLSSLLSRCLLGPGGPLASAGSDPDPGLLSGRHDPAGSGRYGLPSRRTQGRGRRLGARSGPVHDHVHRDSLGPEPGDPHAAGDPTLGWDAVAVVPP